jgi:hypothetical protein
VAFDVQAENVGGVSVGVFRRRGVFDAACFASSTGLDLCFDHDRTTDFLGDRFGVLGAVGHPPRRGGNPVPDEQLLRLILEKIHGLTVSCRPVSARLD